MRLPNFLLAATAVLGAGADPSGTATASALSTPTPSASRPKPGAPRVINIGQVGTFIARVEDCTNWEVTEKRGIYFPKCTGVVNDWTHESNYSLIGAKVIYGSCESWSVDLASEYVTPKCDYLLDRNGQYVPQTEPAPHGMPAVKREEKPVTRNIFQEKLRTDRHGRMACAYWNVVALEADLRHPDSFVVKPQCAEWSKDQVQPSPYFLVHTELSSGTCAAWTVKMSANTATPVCHTEPLTPEQIKSLSSVPRTTSSSSSRTHYTPLAHAAMYGADGRAFWMDEQGWSHYFDTDPPPEGIQTPTYTAPQASITLSRHKGADIWIEDMAGHTLTVIATSLPRQPFKDEIWSMERECKTKWYPGRKHSDHCPHHEATKAPAKRAATMVPTTLQTSVIMSKRGEGEKTTPKHITLSPIPTPTMDLDELESIFTHHATPIPVCTMAFEDRPAGWTEEDVKIHNAQMDIAAKWGEWNYQNWDGIGSPPRVEKGN